VKEHKMKRTASIVATALMMVGASASMASASSVGDGSDYGTQPGFAVSTAATPCSGHGSFNAFGKDFNLAGGADGTQTGINNSTLCGQPHS
jgi:hypothetical protein